MATSGGSAIPLARTGPVIDYTSLDFDSLVGDLTTYAQSTYADKWTDFNPTQFAVVFLELTAYVGDLMGFNLNAAAREVVLTTAQRRQHLIELARSLGVSLRGATAATADLVVTSNPGDLPYAMPAGSTKFNAGDVVFQPDVDYTITATPQTIGVVEGDRYADVALGASTGARLQSKQVPHSPVIEGTMTVSVNGAAWTEVTTFTLSSPSDEHYRVTVDDEGVSTVLFGDGVQGKIPPAAQAVTATYKIGGGRRGRVGAGTIKTLTSVPVGTLSVTNPAMAVGGDDGETIEQARASVPAQVAAGDRCVNLPDYAVAAVRAGGVAKASARQIDHRLVEVAIAPIGGGASTVALRGAVAAYLNARRMVGHRVRVVDATYVRVVLEVDVFVPSTSNTADIRTTVQAAFITANPDDAQNGLLDFDNVGFGAHDDAGTPQATVQAIYTRLSGLQVIGLQTSVVAKLTTIPALKPLGVVNSGDAALTWTVNEADELLRRRWRIEFTSATTYDVFEGIVARSTGMTGDTLVDDRARLPNLTSVVATVNPNFDQVDVALAVNEAASTATTIKLANATDNLFSYATPGNRYRLEWPANPATGTVGVAYAPTKQDGTGDPHGFTWTVTGTGFTAGNEYTIGEFANVDDLLLDDDEIPSLAAADVTINVRPAHATP